MLFKLKKKECSSGITRLSGLRKCILKGLSQTKYIHTYMFPHTYQDPNRLMWKMGKKVLLHFHIRNTSIFIICVTEKSLLIFFVCTSVIDFLKWWDLCHLDIKMHQSKWKVICVQPNYIVTGKLLKHHLSFV